MKSIFSSEEELKSVLLAKDPSDFVAHHVFVPVPYLFEANHISYSRWKTVLSRGLDVDSQDICVVGSASVGFSLSPTKNFRRFDENSDIDCGIISPFHFDVAWRYLRKKRTEWLSLSREVKNAIENHRSNKVFSGVIATDAILGLLPFGGQWQPILDEMGRTAPTNGRVVKIRIYKDYDALRAYHEYGVRQLRDELISSVREDQNIGIEE